MMMLAAAAPTKKLDLSPDVLWDEMGPMAKFVTALLIIMALAALAVFIERLVVYIRTQRKSREFAQASGTAIDRRDYAAVQVLAKQHVGSLLAEMVSGGLEVFTKATSDAARGLTNHLPPVELSRRELSRRLEGSAAKLRRGMPVLATVSSVSPFVGLLGTVVGILKTFSDMSESGGTGLGSVIVGIAEALVVTGIGLGVAIPAVLGFNFLQSMAEKIELGLATAASELGDHLENAHGGGGGGGGHSGRPSDEHLRVPDVGVGNITPAGAGSVT